MATENATTLKELPMRSAELALEATYQIEAMVTGLRDLDLECETASAIMQNTLLNRIKQLNSLVMSVLSDEELDIHDMNRLVEMGK